MPNKGQERLSFEFDFLWRKFFACYALVADNKNRFKLVFLDIISKRGKGGHSRD